MSHRHLTDPSLSSSSAHHNDHHNHYSPSMSSNPISLLNEYGPRRPTDPAELRKLVLDYLCHQCFVDTAAAFARESASNLDQDDQAQSMKDKSAPLDIGLKRPSIISQGSQPSLQTAAVKDVVIERTVRFDTDEDGDAEMDDVIQQTPEVVLNGKSSSRSHAEDMGAAKVDSDLSKSLANGSIHPSPTRSGILQDNEFPADHTESYPDWTTQDIQTTRVRLAIKGHIVAGRVKEAIKLIESHFPQVLGPSVTSKTASINSLPGGNPALLGTSSSAHSHLKSQRLKSNRVSFTNNRPLSGNMSSTPSSSGDNLVLVKHSSPSPKPSLSTSRQQSLKASTDYHSSLRSLNTSSAGASPTNPKYQFPHAMFGSLNPAHIALNLQIQFFVEFVRSISQNQAHATNGMGIGNLEHESEASANNFHHHLRASNTINQASLIESASHVNGKMPENRSRKFSGSSPINYPSINPTGLNNTNDLSNSTGGLSDDTSTTSSSTISTRTTSLALSLPHCRALHDFVHQLPEPIERAIFAKELENVAGLLAYVDPWDSPVKKYLDQSRRDLLAERVNAAILGE